MHGPSLHARVNIFSMKKIEAPGETIVSALLDQRGRGLCVLDSCGVGRSGSNRLIAGIDPIEVHVIDNPDPLLSLRAFDELLTHQDRPAIFTISYDLGLKLNGIRSIRQAPEEPDIYVALFDSLLIHQHSAGAAFTTGADNNDDRYDRVLKETSARFERNTAPREREIHGSNFTRSQYLAAVDQIKELIRAGETYQANLTQQLSVPLSNEVLPADIFSHLRANHPAPFAAYVDRGSSFVVSASPEQFVSVERSESGRSIMTSPIKGTRPRGADRAHDERMRADLLNSEKDRAENTMIVDLMRNDLGRVCEFGSVKVDELCRLDFHPTLFHLVSEVSGTLRDDVRYSDVIKAVFPCGSITGAPKLRTMQIIDRIETVPRGLSMGAIGCRIAPGHIAPNEIFEMSVAIRTMVIRDGEAVFNVGGGVTIDSDPAAEYDESMLKAKALLNSLHAHNAKAA